MKEMTKECRREVLDELVTMRAQAGVDTEEFNRNENCSVYFLNVGNAGLAPKSEWMPCLTSVEKKFLRGCVGAIIDLRLLDRDYVVSYFDNADEMEAEWKKVCGKA